MSAWTASSPTGGVWDPAAGRRADERWLLERWLLADTRVATYRDGLVAVADEGVPRWEPATRWARPPDVWAFLGLAADGSARFAAASPPVGAGSDWLWRSLRELPADSVEQVFGGAALLNWHATHRHCPRCGAESVPTNGGWQRRCAADGSDHFPRVDPAVIMLVHDGGDRALLGRQRRWPAHWYSTLAGFVEPGESLEAAVAREVAEEVGLRVLDSRYLGSQPWPFPTSLMVGFHAETAGEPPTPDGEEIAEAVWVSRESLAADCAAGRMSLPPAVSISRWLIQQWYGAELPGQWSR